MKLAIASGKGGTGKTTVSVALALVAEQAGQKVHYLDCDVEEPNGKLFLKPKITAAQTVYVPIPEVNRELCSACGDCSELCQFNAIVSQGEYAMVFPELCHSCGGCRKVCPDGAITKISHPVGLLTTGNAGKITFTEGLLNVGQAMATPVIKAVKAQISADSLAILDAPPGTSCAMVATVHDADFVLLVTEPTPFGLHDLKIAVETVRTLNKLHAVVINRFAQVDNCVDQYCQEQGIDVLLRIPNSRAVAQAYSSGQTLMVAMPEIKAPLKQVLATIATMVGEQS